MDKKAIIAALTDKIENELAALQLAAKTSYEYATDTENKPENEYDTRGLEASYLAHGQAKRVSEVKEILNIFKTTRIINFTDNDPIAPTALIELSALEGTADKKLYVLIMHKGGGESVQMSGKTIQVVTPISPLGEALTGQSVGDVVTVAFGHRNKEYEIVNVF